MFLQRFEDILSLSALQRAFEAVDTRSVGIDDISLMAYEEKLIVNLQLLYNELLDGSYAPQPLERFEIAKPNSDEKRPIALGSIRDKVVQNLLLQVLMPHYEEIFSDKSYAYRPEKSHIKAIARTRDFIQRGFSWVIRTDIDNFFETIAHDRLLQLLKQHIKDPLILRLIELFIRNGLFEDKEYRNHRIGIHQGAFKEHLIPLALFHSISEDERKKLIDLAILRGYERYHDEHPSKSRSRTDPIERKKIEYAHAFARLSTLHVTTQGVFIGMAKNRYIIKERGKVTHSVPKAQIERVIINAKGITLSSSLIESCARAKIPIDFIDYTHTPYASLLTHHAPLPQTTIAQNEIFVNGGGVYLAREFVEGKAKNQINYLKYLNRYHGTLAPLITKMESTLRTMKKEAKTSAQVMGFEGGISAMYWEALQSIVDPSWGWSVRVTRGAGDTVNSALNYAYAILYGKIQESLVRSGLSLYISYLHVPDQGKPTLVFDMIEEFRAFVIDRTIITMLNRNEPIRVDNSGKLTALARKLIAQNVFERLGSYTTWKKESRRVTTIISYQAYLLSRHIHGEDKYTAFIGKY